MEDSEDMITDITLDHLPDLSDASLSFQIPTEGVSADLLLADHTAGFDLLRNARDDDDDQDSTSFALLSPSHPRRHPLTLSELTPRAEATPRPPPPARSPTRPVRASVQPPSSAKPSAAQHPLTLGNDSPRKRTKTPSRAKSAIPRRLDSPFVSEERLGHLRAEVETLCQPGAIPHHVQARVTEPVDDGSINSKGPSRTSSRPRNDTAGSQVASEELDLLLEEKVTCQSAEILAPPDHDAVEAPGDDGLAGMTHVPVPTPRPKLKRNPRTCGKPTAMDVQPGDISKRPAFPETHVSKKTKNNPPRVEEAYQVPPSAARQLTPPQSTLIGTEEGLVPPACKNGDIVSSSRNTQITHPNRMAERLVSYTQTLMSSIGLHKSSLENTSTDASSDDAVRVAVGSVRTRPPAAAQSCSSPPKCINDVPSPHTKPLRLSEISPQKPPPYAPQPSSPADTATIQDGRQLVTSPMRLAKKRFSMDADLPPQECHRRKRGVLMPADADSERGSSDEAVSQAPARPTKKARHEDQPFSHSETRHSARHPDSSRPTLPNARTKYRPKLYASSQRKGPTLNRFPYLTSSRQVQINEGKCKRDQVQAKAASVHSESSLNGFSASSRLRRDKRTRQGSGTTSCHERPHSGPSSAADLPLIEKKENATFSVAQLTKPVGFTFRVDARLEARKTDERLTVSEAGKTHSHHAVPDLRALRASHQAASTFHRESATSSVPVVPFFFSTEQRAKEREKFDEMVRAKEEEMQRLKEAERRREAEDEERAIRELRRKAIPKANEIPEWYADMPKRKGTAV